MEKSSKNRQYYKSCMLCPRKCGIDRIEGRVGFCKATAELKVARAALHFWEEPCISGTNGSGTVFFSGCNMHCSFCQNEAISWGKTGKIIDTERLAEIYLELQEKGANNINLVTPTHYVPHVISSVEKAREQGLKLPILYNSSGYELVDTLKALEGIVDVYLPDFKYMSETLGAEYSHASNYSEVAKLAIAEMVRQQPKTIFTPEGMKSKRLSLEAKEGYIIKRGVIVRQLLLPEALEDAKQIISYLHETYGNQIYISMMSQYTPMEQVKTHPVLSKKIAKEEYDSYVSYGIKIGIEQGFIQEDDVALESFIPHFDNEGV